MAQIETPVALFVFNRPELTQRVFDLVRAVKPKQLLLVADGPRNDRPEEPALCKGAQSVLRKIDWPCDVRTNISQTNLGCRERVSSGVSWVFEQVEEAIILEDDCLPDLSFFSFCEELLKKYRHDSRIGLISGDNFLEGRNRTPYSYYFTRHTHIWGWASWRRAWKNYDVRMTLWPEVRDGNWLADILGENQALICHWQRIFEQVYRGEIDTWDYQLTFMSWINGFLNICPSVNLVSNIGFGPEATHTTQPSSNADLATAELSPPLSHPPYIVRDALADMYSDRHVFQVVDLKISPRCESEFISLPISKPTTNTVIPEDIEDVRLVSPGLRRAQPSRGKTNTPRGKGKADQAFPQTPDISNGGGYKNTAQENTVDQTKILQINNTVMQAIQVIRSGQLDQALDLLVEAKRLRIPVRDLDYTRAVCFLEMKKLGEAREALREELRHFPENSDAQTLLEDVIAQEKNQTPESHHVPDEEFQELLAQIRPYSMLPELRLFSLFSLAKQVCVGDMPGNFVECGVAGGGSTAMLATLIQRYSKRERKVFACDSFEGMPLPSEHDSIHGVSADDTGWGTGTCAAPESSVIEIAQKMSVADIVIPVKGYFENTLPPMKEEIGEVAFLHVDCDWYESTLSVFNTLYDQLTPGAVVQVDDYGYWDGMKKAIDEFSMQRGLTFAMHDIGGAAWFQRPSLPG